MIEQGLVLLLQGSPAVSSIATAGGGYMAQLPKDPTPGLPSWTWTTVADHPQYGLQAQPGLTMWRVQIDCYGLASAQGADCIALATAINSVLSGFQGTLTDPDATKIDSAFKVDQKDFYDGEARTYRRMLEYRVWYYADS